MSIAEVYFDPIAAAQLMAMSDEEEEEEEDGEEQYINQGGEEFSQFEIFIFPL